MASVHIYIYIAVRVGGSGSGRAASYSVDLHTYISVYLAFTSLTPSRWDRIGRYCRCAIGTEQRKDKRSDEVYRRIARKRAREIEIMDPQTRAHWEKDLKDLHMVYDYNAKDKQGNPEKWRYEIWFQMEVSRCGR